MKTKAVTTEKRRSQNIRDFLQSYDDVLVQNKYSSHTLLTTQDLLDKAFEDKLYPYCSLISSNTPLVGCNTRFKGECTINDDQTAAAAKDYELNQQSFLNCYVTALNQSFNKNMSGYYLLRTGILYSYSGPELMSLWFRIQKNQAFRNIQSHQQQQ
jgi:hypothetical protein